MATIDIIQLGNREVLIQIFRVPNIPEQIGFGRYYEGTCEVGLKHGDTIRCECVIHRPENRRNVVGVRVLDWLLLVFKTDLTPTSLSGATITVARYGLELSETEAMARRSLP